MLLSCALVAAFIVYLVVDSSVFVHFKYLTPWPFLNVYHLFFLLAYYCLAFDVVM